MTHALLAGSPAIGGGDASLAGSTDQRGSVRVCSRALDIGAFQTEPATHFAILTPSQVNAGEPFCVTVVALDQWGNAASTFGGTVHFRSTDSSAGLPDNYTFLPDDAGVHTFTVTLQTPGQQQLTVREIGPFSHVHGRAKLEVMDP